MNSPKRQGFRFLIYPRFQITLLLVNSAILVAAFGLVSFQFVRSFERLKELGSQANFAVDHPYFRFLDLQSAMFLKYQAIALILAMVLTWVTTLLLSHRLAGPIVRLCSFFKNTSETGKWELLQFRKKDFFQELPPLINNALATLTKTKNS